MHVAVLAVAALLAATLAASASADRPERAEKCLGDSSLGYGGVGYVSRTVGRRLPLGRLAGTAQVRRCDDTPCGPTEPCPPREWTTAVRRLKGIRPRIAVAARWEGRWSLFVAIDRCALARPTSRLYRCLHEGG